MCVGLSAKVIKITDGTALVDASGAKRNISVELLEDHDTFDYVSEPERFGLVAFDEEYFLL